MKRQGDDKTNKIAVHVISHTEKRSAKIVTFKFLFLSSLCIFILAVILVGKKKSGFILSSHLLD